MIDVDDTNKKCHQHLGQHAIQSLGINRKGDEKTSCPICFDEISEKRKWTAFHTCGHQTCCNCFKGLAAYRL